MRSESRDLMVRIGWLWKVTMRNDSDRNLQYGNSKPTTILKKLNKLFGMSETVLLVF
ncbi:MAG: hypothetical protein CM15mP32_6210 [Flavobacteriaceae bacterium]|nr:MAG: hypothetical protein CM15mP32_6210 [Flavobacteriaceae bacterium]